MKTPKRILLERKNSEEKKIFLGRRNSEEKIFLEGKRDSGVPRTGFVVAMAGGHSWN